MTAVFVTFRYSRAFDERAVREIAATARAKFEGMPGLRHKIFTVNTERREATNVYVWQSEAAARAFFTPALLENVAALYGTRPVVVFAPVAASVDNLPQPDAG